MRQTTPFPLRRLRPSLSGALVIAALLFSLSACADQAGQEGIEQDTTAMEDTAQNTVVDAIQRNSQLSTFYTAIDSAGLVETLRGEGPYTVFAPTNQAFNQFLQSANLSQDSLLQNTDRLSRILRMHVVEDSLAADSLRQMTQPLESMEDQLSIVTRNNNLLINDASVTQAGLQASNGIVHIVDRVLADPQTLDQASQ